jgi:hypothetical protein
MLLCRTQQVLSPLAVNEGSQLLLRPHFLETLLVTELVSDLYSAITIGNTNAAKTMHNWRPALGSVLLNEGPKDTRPYLIQGAAGL